MRSIIKCTAIVSAVILFCAIGVWVEAVDVKGTYKKAKETADNENEKNQISN